MIIFHLSPIQPSADPLQHFIAIIAFISHLFSKIEERDPARHRQTAREREMGHKFPSEIRCVPKGVICDGKKYEFAHAMKNDTSILSLKERKRGGGKSPNEEVMDWCPRVYFASRCGISNSDFPHQWAVASEMIPTIFRQWSCFRGMQIKHTWMDFIAGVSCRIAHQKPGVLVWRRPDMYR